MLSCEELAEFAPSISLVEGCDRIQNGMLRLATPFRYPNGATIDLFLGPSQQLIWPYVVSDLGETVASLLDQHLKVWTTKRRKQIVSDICRILDVTQDGGELKIFFSRPDELAGAMVRLAQACIRVSDIAFTQRHAPQAAFKDDVEEFISSLDLTYEPNPEFIGMHGNRVVVDFEVIGRRLPSLVQTVSSASSASAHPVANEVFRKWYDLSQLRQTHNLVSIYESRNNVFRDDDITRLSDVSTVLAFPEQQDQIGAVLET